MVKSIFYYLFIFALLTLGSAQNGGNNETSSTTTVRTTSIRSTSTRLTSTESPASSTIAPIPQIPDWAVKGTNGTCLLLSGNMTFSVNYNTISGSTAYGQIPIPKTATATGTCVGYTNQLVLTWPSGGQGSPGQMANTITLLFLKKPVYMAGNLTNMGAYALVTIFGSVTADFPDASPGQTYYISAKPVGTLAADLQSSYKCLSSESIAADKTGMTQLTFSDLQVQAFHEGAANTFDTEMVCAKDTVSTVLPIIGYVVGGLLVVAILGGFAWMKFRQAGYSPM